MNSRRAGIRTEKKLLSISAQEYRGGYGKDVRVLVGALGVAVHSLVRCSEVLIEPVDGFPYHLILGQPMAKTRIDDVMLVCVRSA